MTQELSPVRVEMHGAVALVLIDNPPVNAASAAVRAGLVRAMGEANANPAASCIVIACEGRTFVAGADIREFGKPIMLPHLTEVIDQIEWSGKPVVAAIHGTALGGGFEIALGCHARVMAKDAAVGLPEVKIGVLPGAGGTQRLPRLTGMAAALEIATSGRQVRAPEALKLGIADAIAQGDLAQAAMAHALGLVGTQLRRLSATPVPVFDAAALAVAVSAVKKKARGQLSPGRAADAVALAATLPFTEGMAAERAAFMELVASPQAGALRHAFFGEREVARVPQLEGAKAREVKRIGVIGAGTMGAGISVAMADAGYLVSTVESSIAAVGAGHDRINALYARQVKSGRISADEQRARMGLIEVSDDFDGLKNCDLIIEAAFEEMSVKQDIFSRLGKLAKAGAVLASNTSYLDINAIGAASGRPQDVIGMHFFSPANIMRLVEVVQGKASARDAVATGLAVVKRAGKVGVVCGVCDGFVGNRMLNKYKAIVEFAVEDGALPQEVDGALEAYGFAMGPFAVADLAGLDIGMLNRKRLAATRDARERYGSTVADKLCEQGRFGQKTGKGWYLYADGKRVVDPAVTALVIDVSKQKSIARRAIAPETIQRHVLAALANEGAKILAEGIVPRSLDIDIVYLNGYGFPAYCGGPMFAADARGLKAVLADVEAIHASAGAGFEPAPLLVELAARDGKFGDWKAGKA